MSEPKTVKPIERPCKRCGAAAGTACGRTAGGGYMFHGVRGQ